MLFGGMLFNKSEMIMQKCRVCYQPLLSKPFLKLINMPKMSQYLPEKKWLGKDKGVTLNVWQCSGCGLVQLGNKPVSYYREVIRASAVSPEMTVFRVKQFHDFVKKYNLTKKAVIEVGCGRGEYLSILKDCGVKAYGLEYGRTSVKEDLKKGLRVSHGFIDKGNIILKNAPFAGFMILNFLEHLPNPDTLLSGLKQNLSDGAVGLIEVPNFEMICQKRLFSEFTSDHLLYFTKETLETTLRLNGFEVLSLKSLWHNYILSAEVRKVKPLNPAPFLKQKALFKAKLKTYLKKYGNKKVAFWGAGHQALAVISTMEIADKIRYVIDSALFKQGKYTPVTHLPIVNPERLKTDPVKLIMVGAAGYSDEIVKTIRRTYGKKMKIVVLKEFDLKEQ